jgi:hypothetical protein
MFKKIGRLAEKAANKVSLSRRGFLSRLGQMALGVTAVLAGVSAATAQSGVVVCCKRHCPSTYKGPRNFTTGCYPAGWTCTASYPCQVVSQFTKASCDKCWP